MGPVLIIFDSLDKYGDGDYLSHKHDIQAFLQSIFDRTTSDSKILVTSENKLHSLTNFESIGTGFITRYYNLKPLSDKDSAKLFCRLANQFRYNDVLQHTRLMVCLCIHFFFFFFFVIVSAVYASKHVCG